MGFFTSPTKRRGSKEASSPGFKIVSPKASSEPTTTAGVDDLEPKPPSPPSTPEQPKKADARLMSPPSGDLAFRKEAARLERMIEKMSKDGESMAPTWLKPVFQYIPQIFVNLLHLIRVLTPFASQAYDLYLWSCANLPLDLVQPLFGLVLVFFGGTFSLTLSAYEAFKVSGFSQTRAALQDLADEWNSYRLASASDDTLDDDGDGVPDVDQIDGPALIRRKVSLALRVSDPAKVHLAVSGVGQGLVGVVASLRFKHARTVTLGCTIGEYLRRPAGLYLTPTLAQVVTDDGHRKWIPYVVDYGCKCVAVTIAVYVHAVLSSVQAAIRGGLMFSRGMMSYLSSRGHLPAVDPDDTYADEAVGWTLAAVGCYVQIVNGFGLPFPLNLLLGPVRIIEAALGWVVNSQ